MSSVVDNTEAVGPCSQSLSAAKSRVRRENIWLLALMLCVASGAYLATPFPVAMLVAMVLLGVLLRARFISCLVAFSLACAVSAHWWERLDVPLPLHCRGRGTVFSDPKPVFASYELIVACEGRRYKALLDPNDVPIASQLQAGQRVTVDGRVSKLAGKTAAHLRRKHVAGVLHVKSIELVPKQNAAFLVANKIRAHLQRGSELIHQGPLLLGLTIGDDRYVDQQTRDNFRDSGVAHLTAVSGANVAFVLALFAPFITRFALRGRFLMSLIVLVMFGLVTRFEPSVIRAEAMAAAVLFGNFIGRPVTSFRALCIGVTGALLVDPFLVGSVGFLLSASACFGMATIGGWLSHKIPGPRLLSNAIGYTAGAQLGVLPVLVPVFGWPSVVAPAVNLLAAPLAAVILVTGIPAMAIGAFTGAPAGEWLLVPTRVALDLLVALAATGANYS